MPTREQRARKFGVTVDQLPDGRGKNPNSWKNRPKGVDHPRWNSDRIITQHGYVRVRVGVGHPLSDPNGYAYEHLVVWCNAGRQPPESGQVIHHRNEDKTDNAIQNLELLTRQEHAAEHHKMVSNSAVREIRVRYAAGEDGTALAVEFDIPMQRVYRYIHGETRKSAGGPIQAGLLRGKKAAGACSMACFMTGIRR